MADQNDPPMTPNDQFNAILKDDAGREALRKFLTSGFSEQHLAFWEAVQVYRKLGASDLKTNSQRIFDEYIRAGTKLQINVTEQVRVKIVKALENPTLGMFDEAEQTALELIKGNYLLPFVQSDLYQSSRAKSAGDGKGKVEVRHVQTKSPKSSSCCIL